MQPKSLKPYLPYYLRQEVLQSDGEIGRLVGLSEDKCMLVHSKTGSYGEDSSFHVMPILRPPEDTTTDEIRAWQDMSLDYPATLPHWLQLLDAARTHYLCSIGIDVFGLIPAGLAVKKEGV